MKRMLLLTVVAITILSASCFIEERLRKPITLEKLKLGYKAVDYKLYLKELVTYGAVYVGTIKTKYLPVMKKLLNLPDEMPSFTIEDTAVEYSLTQNEEPYSWRFEYIGTYFAFTAELVKYVIVLGIAEGVPIHMYPEKSIFPWNDSHIIRKILKFISYLEINDQLKESY